MKIRETVRISPLLTLQVGTWGILPIARFLVGSVVKSTHIGPGAARRAWRSYQRAH
jgi:hypothetical protein